MKLNFSPLAEAVLAARYLAKDGRGRPVESPAQMLDRVAQTVARAESVYDRRPEEWAEKFLDLMAGLKFLPNSPTLMNAGRRLGQLSACFVLPIRDSMSSIFDTLKQAALIHQSGGGTGFDFSPLRPSGDLVRSTHGVSSGPVSFMRVFDMACETIKQGGTRRGANMGLLRVDHPDILDFIRTKNGPGLSNFNLSVLAPDSFMTAVAGGEEIDLINPRTNQPAGRLAAGEIMDALVASAHATGEPGVVFIDAVNRANPTPALGLISATNPCGEQPLLAYESCNLGSLNLVAFASPSGINWKELGLAVDLAVRFLDDVITINRYPLPDIERVTLGNRKIGLGVMGLADLLITLGRPYASEAALRTAEEIMSFIQHRARSASERLGLERGSFANFGGSIWDGPHRAMRNATVTTIAPTGSLSLLAGVSSGVEPLFGLAMDRRILVDKGPLTGLCQPDPRFLRALALTGTDSPEVVEEVVASGRAGDVTGVPTELKRLFAVAQEIDYTWHLRLQAAFQRHTDNAVSKTINLPAGAGPEVVSRAIEMAHGLELKGLTLYRDGSRTGQTLSLGLDPDACPVCGPRHG